MREKKENMEMLKTLEIRNFKSIKHVKLDCRRINVFIGEPNTGKSNILESLGLLSWVAYGNTDLREFIRYENLLNLFYDLDLGERISISIDNSNLLELRFENGEFILESANQVYARFNYTGANRIRPAPPIAMTPFKYYKFRVRSEFPGDNPSFLYPPDGENLLTVLLANKELKSLIFEVFNKFGLKPVFKPVEKKIEVQKEIDGIVIAYPYSLISDTLQRIIFYITAIESNKDSILIFEEPEANAFPFYTKFLAERIALDESNQYFISTHNPYLLLSILGKAPEKDVQIFVTYFEDYQTKVKTLSDEQKSEILDLDASVFFNLQRFLEGF
ncbi:TPA_asm: AAA family ATPase [Geoglobus ahangari pleomorphic virus 1]|uniref:AAA domain n=2 Tax=root TaxID=1 RepID=A0A0F7IFR5_9EURY|nr:AAA family ATPase [Geoglobus ahangari]AKG92408.1 AAA domain [Geoglobus ahangari]